MEININRCNDRLSKVFEALIQTCHVIKDDTLAEKLIGLFQQVAPDRASCLKLITSTTCTTFLSSCASTLGKGDEGVEVQRFILALRMAAWLGSLCFEEMEVASESLILSCVFDAADIYWNEAAVRNAWLLGLHQLAQHHQGFHWILKKDYLKKGTGSLNDSSIFVSTAAQKLVVYFLIHHKQNTLVQVVEHGNNLPEESWWNDLLKSVGPFLEFPSVGKLKVTVGLLEKVQSHGKEGSFLLDLILQQFGVVHKVVQLMLNESSSAEADVWSSLLLKVLDLAWPVGHDKDESIGTKIDQAQITSLPETLVAKGCVITALRIAAWLIPRCCSPVTDTMVKILLSPVLNLKLESRKNIIGDPRNGVPTESEALHTDLKLFTVAVKLAADVDHEACPDFPVYICNALEQTTGMNTSGKGMAANTRVQHLLLDALISTESTWSGKSHLSLVLKTCISLLQSNKSSTVMVKKSFQIISKCLPNMITEQMHETDTLTELTEVVQRKLCDVKWEMRDNTVEFLGHMIQNNQGCNKIVQWLCDQKFHLEVWRSVTDGESYVRASALKALGFLSCHEELWNCLSLVVEQDEILDKVVALCQDDTEAFARRQAVQLLCQWVCHTQFCTSSLEKIHRVLAGAIHDFDWEVKLLVLDFWEKQIDGKLCNVREQNSEEVPLYATALCLGKSSQSSNDLTMVTISNILDSLHQQGCLQGVLHGVNDYDPSVKHKACQILIKARDYLIKQNMTEIYDNVTEEPPVKKSKMENSEGEGEKKQDVQCKWLIHSCSDFVKIVCTVDLETIMETSKGMDNYDINPESLLDDILTSLKYNDEDNFVDCY